MTRVLVCGGRRFNNRDAMMQTLRPYENKVRTEPSPHKIIVGGAPGADALAEEWARCFAVPFRVFPADWSKHGRAAGPLRNQRMLDEGRPDIVIAFTGGSGTADMVRRARKAGVEVLEVPA